jgi:hypothetical protein
VLFGEASVSRSRELGLIALKAVGTETVKLVTDLAPSEVVPHGAAMWARLVQGPPKGFISCPPPGWKPGQETFGGPVDTLIYNRLLEAPMPST